jgi:NAD(P)-dependent dehydrogenase (short-subunit alcohol dehydrogenase family)
MRNWFITGTGSGFGRALAEAALARGDRVIGTLLDPVDTAAFEALAPGRVKAVILDVTDKDAATHAVEAAGPIDVLVNNAGYSLEGVVEASSLGEIRRLIETHLIAPIALIQAALPAMRKQRSGHIINIGSQAAHMPGGGVSIYAAAKAGIEALSIGLAREVAPFGIRVTVVVPGAFRTALGRARRSAVTRIADYAASDEARRNFLATLTGSQRGDPAKGAAAILAMTDLAEPPLRFALGPDAIEGLRAHAAELLGDAERWAPLGAGTDF